MKFYKKTDEKIESQKNTREMVESVAWVLKHKKGIPNSPERELLLREAPRIRLCGKKKRKSEWRRHEPRWHPYCDHPCCPWCQVERAEKNKLALIAQFTGYDPELLYIVTLSSGPGNVRGPELAAAMEKMDDAFDRLCRLVAWKKVVKRCGGPQHRSWEPKTRTHDLGFRVHNQLICLVKTKKPRWRQIKECFRRILGLPKGTPEDTYFFAERLKSLEGHAEYLTSVEQLVPGYDPEKLRKRSEMMNIPDEDLVEFIKAVPYRQHVYFRGLDRSRKPPKPKPKWTRATPEGKRP